MKKFKNKTFVNYYAVATEDSYYIKKGTIQQIPKANIAKVAKNKEFGFVFTENMHFDTDVLKCKIIKETITKTYEILK